GVARGLEAELARGGEVEEPRGEYAVLDDGAAPVGDALGIERLRAQATLAVRILAYGNSFGEDLLSQLVLEEAGAARDRRAADGAGEVADKAASDPRIEHHRDLLRGDFARLQALDRALACALADRGGLLEVRAVDRAREIVVALHPGAVAGNDRDADALARGLVAAGETVGGCQHYFGAAPACLGALGIGDAGHGARRVLGRHRALDQRLRRGLRGIQI